MDNVEITVKVNGKEVDITTISDETFRNVREVAADFKLRHLNAALATFDGEPRVIFKVTGYLADTIKDAIGEFVCIDKDGRRVSRKLSLSDYQIKYDNIRPLGE